jgi:hypothetical protein
MTDFATQQTQWQRQKDSEHLRLLSIFFYVVAGLAVLISCAFVGQLIIGYLAIFSPETLNDAQGQQTFPPVFGAMFLFGGLFAQVMFWSLAILLALTGRYIRQRRRWLFCLVVSGLACVFGPFGTVLGVFSIIVLVRPSVKVAFGVPLPPAPPAVPPTPPNPPPVPPM